MNPIFNLVVFLVIISSILILGLIVLLKNSRNLLNISFFLFTLSVIGWNSSAFVSEIVTSSANKVLLSKFSYSFAILSIFFTIIFSNIFVNIKNRRNFAIFNILLITAVVLLTIFTNSVILSITPTGDTFNINNGALSWLFNLTVGILVTQVIILPIIGYRKARGIKKNQIKFLFLGFVLYALTAIFFTIVLKLLINSDKYYKFGNYSVIILIGFATYAIVKHKMLDIRMVVARSVAYLILLATLAGIYAGAILGFERILFPQEASQFSLGQGALRTVISVIMVFLFQPLKKWITEITDKIFFKNQYNPEELLSALSHTVSSTILLIEMLYKVNDLLISNMKLSRSAFVIFKNKDEAYTSQAIGYKGWPPIDVPDFVKLANKGILIYDELEENSIYKKLMRKYDSSIIVPIKTETELIGVFLGGEKNSGDMFNQQDIQIFEIMGPEVAVGVENAKAYEEISKFNVTLRQEVKRATSRLKEKNEELKELDKAKDEFISMASHQLRTPLTAIKGYLSMLLEGDAGEIKVSQYDFINEAYSAAGRMVGLINDLLNVSRMETGRFFLEPKECDIERIVGEEVKQLQNHAREKGIYLKIEARGKVPHIWADETKIRQVVMNFIDNAIYYTQKGGVTVNMSKDKENFVFQVFDTGIGVPKVQKEHLFEKFFRADNARQTRPDGTGLGIYLAKRVVEDHGGKVLFDSEEGKGSMFGFKFPLKVKTPPTIASAPSPDRPAAPHPAAPALTSAAATFNAKEAGIEPPIATHPE